jgi:hypothetical protein
MIMCIDMIIITANLYTRGADEVVIVYITSSRSSFNRNFSTKFTKDTDYSSSLSPSIRELL